MLFFFKSYCLFNVTFFSQQIVCHIIGYIFGGECDCFFPLETFCGKKIEWKKNKRLHDESKKKCVHLLSLFFDFKDGLRKSVLLRGEKKTGENVTDKKNDARDFISTCVVEASCIYSRTKWNLMIWVRRKCRAITMD